METAFLIKAIAFGVAVAAPVGPMSLLFMQRTLQHGIAAAMTFAAGIAAADGTYAVIAAFGISALGAAMLAATWWIKAVGSLVLIYLGIRMLRQREPATANMLTAANAGRGAASGRRAFAAAYAMTLANPPTIVFFASVFASVVPVSSLPVSSLPAANSAVSNSTIAGFAHAGLFSLGVFLGSLLWWMLLTTLVARTAAFINPGRQRMLSRLAGLLLIAFGAYAMAQLFAGI